MNAAAASKDAIMPTAPSGTRPSAMRRPESHPASGLPRPMPRATQPTTTLVFSSSHRGFWASPSMYTAARMNATTNVKNAMPTSAVRRAFVEIRVRMLATSGP